MPDTKDAHESGQWRTEPSLPPARPGRRPAPSQYREQIEACLAGEVRSTEAADQAEARRIVKRLRHAGDRLNARVRTRVEPDGDKWKVIVSAERREQQ